MMQENGPAVLLVIRSHDLAESFSWLLRAAGYRVLLADSPDEARRLLAADGPDVMLVDIDWGPERIAALTAASHARRGGPCRMAAVVGWWDARAGEAAAQADALVYKPPTERQVLAAVEDLLARLPFSISAS